MFKNNRLLRAHQRACPFKHKLDETNAMPYLLAAQKDAERYRNPKELELYLCTACQFLHIGHRRFLTREAKG